MSLFVTELGNEDDFERDHCLFCRATRSGRNKVTSRLLDQAAIGRAAFATVSICRRLSLGRICKI